VAHYNSLNVFCYLLTRVPREDMVGMIVIGPGVMTYEYCRLLSQ